MFCLLFSNRFIALNYGKNSDMVQTEIEQTKLSCVM